MHNRIWLLFLALSGCTSGAGDDPAIEQWQAQERVAIGVVSGDPMQEFGRLTGAVKLRDGRIVVADHQALELRMFSADGEYRQSIGGRGRGPGEFLGLTRLVRLRGDTLVAGGNLKMATFSPAGELVREQLMDWSGAASRPLFVETQHPLNNGEFVLYLLTSSSGQPQERGLSRSPVMYVLAGPATGVRDTLGSFLGLEQMLYSDSERSHSAIPLFPAGTTLMIGTDHVVIGDQAADSVLRYDLATREASWIRLPLAAEPVPDAVHQEAYAGDCSSASDDETVRRCETSLQMLPRQRHFPVFEDVAVDSLGRVWVKRYPHAVDRADATWLVVGANGQTVATVQLPENLRPMQIGADYVLGLLRDDLGVQSVRDFELFFDE